MSELPSSATSTIAGHGAAASDREEPLLLLTVDEILRRVNSALLFSKGTPATGVRGTDWPEHFEIWSAAEPELQARDSYHVAEFMPFDDADFVATAYRALLHRAPDISGFESFIGRLRDGSLTKVGALAEVRFSAEGMAVGVPVKGLRFAETIEQWKRKPRIGRFLQWLHEFARLDVRADRIARSDVKHSREAHRIGRHVNQVVLEAGMRIAALERDLAHLNAARPTVAAQAVALTRLEERMAAWEREASAIAEADAERAASAAHRDHLMNALYSDFEDRFRGPKELVTARVEPYLEEVHAAIARTGGGPVLDIGCGRGEWLDLLQAHAIEASGVDLNLDFVAEATSRGLKVRGANALDFLPSLEPGSLSVVTSMHVAEHLPFEDLVAMIDGAFSALKSGGTLILETPNPENLDVATLHFYMDPTHRNPLPPELLRWVVESRGFTGARIERLHAHRELTAPALVPAEIPGAQSINNLVSRTHVAPDYAIIGSKPDAA